MKSKLILGFFAICILAFSKANSQEVILGSSILNVLTGNDNQEHDICVLMDSYIDLEKFEASAKSTGKSGKLSIPRLILELQAHANSTQASLISFLAKEGIRNENIQSMWIENVLFFRANEALIKKLSYRTDILEIDANGKITWPLAEQTALESDQRKMRREIGLTAIKAPFMWNKGYTGYGRKIFIIDTGVDPTHKALQRQHAWNNNSIQNVWIPLGNEGFTFDCDQHGTHVLGIACGLDRDKQDTIGVAFNAEWIAGNPIGCFRGVRRNSIITMLQWSMNPDGNRNTIDDVPDVINNSWADYSLGFCSSIYRNMLSTLELADIAVIFSAGNDGPNDRTMSPPHNLELSSVNPFTVGAVNSNQVIAGFSSRGPARCPTNGRISIKPEVSAPGVAVRSSIPGDDYTEFQGTSMAAPHVAGAFILLKEAFPNLNAKELKEALYFSAVDLGVVGNDNFYGNGFINLERAFNYLTNRGNSPSDPSFEMDLELWDVHYDAQGCKNNYRANVLIYNGGKRIIRSSQIKMKINGSPFSSTTMWSGILLPGEKQWISLNGFDAPSGNFTIVFTIEQVNGDGKDDRPINDQLKRKLTLSNANDYEIEVQDDFGDQCVGSRVAISVKDGDADQYDWYDALPLDNIVAQGKTFTPELKEGENSFFVFPRYKGKFVGPELLDEEDLQFGFQNGKLIFELTEPILLKSMDIHSNARGSVSFRFIRESLDTVFTASNFPAFGRPQTLPINRELPIGNYVLEVFRNPGLGYQVENVNFPYEIDNVVSITGATPEFQGVAPYFYFYNWKLDYSHPCGPKEVNVSTNGAGSVPSADFSLSQMNLELPDDATVQTTNTSSSAQDYRWTFGDGGSSSADEPDYQYSAPGLYSVVLIAKGANDCTDAHAVDISVTGTVTNSIENEFLDKILIYPNPINDELFIDASLLGRKKIEIRIISSIGRILFESNDPLTSEVIKVNTSKFDSGLYFISIHDGINILTHKLIKL